MARQARLPLPTPGPCHSTLTYGYAFGTAPRPRELATLAEVTLHGVSKEAALCMGLSEQTVKNHLAHLFMRLGVTCRTQALAELGWLVIPDSVGMPPHEQR